MIGVKGTRNSGGATDAQNPYKFTESAATTRSPAWVGLGISALVLYVTQFFKTKTDVRQEAAEAAEAAAEKDGKGEGASKPGTTIYRQPQSGDDTNFDFGGGDDAPKTLLGAANERMGTSITIPLQGWFDRPLAGFAPPSTTGLRPGGPSNSGQAPTTGQPPAQPPFQGGGQSDGQGDGQSGGGASDDDDPTGGEPQKNRAPRVSDQVFLNEMTILPAFFIAIQQLLQHAQDDDGDPLNVVGISASSGTLTTVEGGWMFQPQADIIGPVILRYLVSDGQDSAAQKAHFIIRPNEVYGGPDDDTLLGSQWADLIIGGDGDDDIHARGGMDAVYGGDGDDHIDGGDGNDRIYAGGGNDTVYAGAGDDFVSGGAGDDKIYGQDGDDILYGDEGADRIEGGAGRDIIWGGTGDDILMAGLGADVVDGGDGADRISGENGNDTILDGGGSDNIDAGQGDDIVILVDDADIDTVTGGLGHDTLSFAQRTDSMDIDITAGTARNEAGTVDVFTQFEAYVGGTGDDHFKAGRANAEVTGGAGKDTFEFAKSETASSKTVYDIVDFEVGDHVKTGRYDIFRAEVDDDGQAFRQSMTQDEAPAHETIRFEHEWDDAKGEDETVIYIDYDHDDQPDFVVFLHGKQALSWDLIDQS